MSLAAVFAWVMVGVLLGLILGGTMGDEPIDDDAVCECGHPLYLHDDGEDRCIDCDCQRFEEE